MMSDKTYYSIIIIGLLFASFENVFTQPLKVESRYYDVDSILFDVQNENLLKNNQYHFFMNDSILVGGFNITKKVDNDKELLVWEKDFIYPLTYKQDLTYIECILYTKDVENISLYIQPSDTSRWYSFKLPFINYDGYQQPYHIDLKYFNIPDNNKIKSIKLIGDMKSSNAKIIIGSIRIFTTNLVVNQYIHPLFGYSLSDMVDNNPENSLKKFAVSPIILSHSAIYNSPGYQLDLVDTNLVQLKRFFENTIQFYPFYKERNINKDSILAKYKLFSDTIGNVQSLISQYATLLRTYNDVHFNVSKSFSGEKTYSPIKLAKLNNNIYVAAVFDSTLNIRRGDHVIAKNGISINTLILDESQKYTGHKYARENFAISSILNGLENEKLTLQVVRQKDTLSIEYIIKNNYKVPSNFFPKHGDFKMINDKIGYLRINSFDDLIWYRYISLDQLKFLEGIIFDLRGNQGGIEHIVFQMLSTLIQRNVIVYHTIIPTYSDVESLCLKPNPYISYLIPRIIVLIDEHTTCAAELFAYLLKKHCNATLIGSTPTAGAYAMCWSINLPDNYRISFNSIIKPFFEGNYSFEGIGIEPNIWVWKSQIKDLYPYEDKILQTAIKYIKKYINSN
jgi:C-terminal processing protease CtpA/Prc